MFFAHRSIEEICGFWSGVRLLALSAADTPRPGRLFPIAGSSRTAPLVPAWSRSARATPQRAPLRAAVLSSQLPDRRQHLKRRPPPSAFDQRGQLVVIRRRERCGEQNRSRIVSTGTPSTTSRSIWHRRPGFSRASQRTTISGTNPAQCHGTPGGRREFLDFAAHRHIEVTTTPYPLDRADGRWPTWRRTGSTRAVLRTDPVSLVGPTCRAGCRTFCATVASSTFESSW